jgi:hypothetical protein
MLYLLQSAGYSVIGSVRVQAIGLSLDRMTSYRSGDEREFNGFERLLVFGSPF